MMRLTRLILLLLLPFFAKAFNCKYNDSAIISRNVLLLELENNQCVRLYDSTINVEENEDLNSDFFFPGEKLHSIDLISFKGYIEKAGIKKYVDTKIDSLKSFRYRQNGNKCGLTFQEAESKRTDITLEEETAIVRLAESCIQYKVCGVNPMQVDKDADLNYQSTQSVFNDLIDFYVPKVVDLFLTKEKIFVIKPFGISKDGVYFSEDGGELQGLDSIQRTTDLLIKSNGTKYTIELGLRFEEIHLKLKYARAGWRFLGTFGDLSASVKGISLQARLAIDIQPSTCVLSLEDAGIVSFKSAAVNVPVLNLFSVEYSFDSNQLSTIQKFLFVYIDQNIPKLNLDCKQHLNKLDEVLS